MNSSTFKSSTNNGNTARNDLFDEVLDVRDDIEWKQGCDPEEEVRESEGRTNFMQKTATAN